MIAFSYEAPGAPPYRESHAPWAALSHELIPGRNKYTLKCGKYRKTGKTNFWGKNGVEPSAAWFNNHAFSLSIYYEKKHDYSHVTPYMVYHAYSLNS
ncbi:MAG: hypothetical protein ABSF52_11465 [Syntrophobacteraceae bacterium]|jgi:hypothetical protein